MPWEQDDVWLLPGGIECELNDVAVWQLGLAGPLGGSSGLGHCLPTPSKMEGVGNWGRGVTPEIPCVVPFSLSWGRLDNWGFP